MFAYTAYYVVSRKNILQDKNAYDFITHFEREIIAVSNRTWSDTARCFASEVCVELFSNKYLKMGANVDQHIRDIQRQYLDFLDDDVRMIIFPEISS